MSLLGREIQYDSVAFANMKGGCLCKQENLQGTPNRNCSFKPCLREGETAVCESLLREFDDGFRVFLLGSLILRTSGTHIFRSHRNEKEQWLLQ